LKRWITTALVGAATMLSAVASGKEPITLEFEPWPAQRACESACVPIQFSTLAMRLPLDDIGNILILGGGSDPALNLLPKSGEVTESLMLLVVPPEKSFKLPGAAAELRKLGITNHERFFDLLGKAPNGNKTLSNLRRAFDVEAASRYTKASKDGLHAYWLKPSEPIGKNTSIENAVYFAIDGSDTAYMLSGVITQAVYETVLSNIRVTKIP
jgi:hypothetical protein